MVACGGARGGVPLRPGDIGAARGGARGGGRAPAERSGGGRGGVPLRPGGIGAARGGARGGGRAPAERSGGGGRGSVRIVLLELDVESLQFKSPFNLIKLKILFILLQPY